VAGVGCCNAGRLERSRVSDFLEARLDARDEESCGLCSGDVEAIFE
jgi:hypothetical protein